MFTSSAHLPSVAHLFDHHAVSALRSYSLGPTETASAALDRRKLGVALIDDQ